MTRVKVNVYVDGFNLYYGSLKGSPYKWLDLGALARIYAGGQPVNRIRYFTAIASGTQDPGVPLRQGAYLKALTTVPGLSIHHGKFLTKAKSMPLAVKTLGKRRFATVLHTEEKGSDVNLATYLVVDGADGDYERAVVISNDSDLMEPVRLATARYGPVTVVSPNPLFSNALKKAAARYIPLKTVNLAACQFPDPLTLPSGASLSKPAGW